MSAPAWYRRPPLRRSYGSTHCACGDALMHASRRSVGGAAPRSPNRPAIHRPISSALVSPLSCAPATTVRAQSRRGGRRSRTARRAPRRSRAPRRRVAQSRAAAWRIERRRAHVDAPRRLRDDQHLRRLSRSRGRRCTSAGCRPTGFARAHPAPPQRTSNDSMHAPRTRASSTRDPSRAGTMRAADAPSAARCRQATSLARRRAPAAPRDECEPEPAARAAPAAAQLRLPHIVTASSGPG